MNLKKTYYIFFDRIYSFCKAVSDDGWEDWKAMVLINGIEILVLVEGLVWWTLLTKSIVNVPKWNFAIPVGLLVVIFNYYFFLHGNKWKEYSREIAKYPKGKINLYNWMALLTVLLALISVFFAFYQMSLVAWSQYR